MWICCLYIYHKYGLKRGSLCFVLWGLNNVNFRINNLVYIKQLIFEYVCVGDILQIKLVTEPSQVS